MAHQQPPGAWPGRYGHAQPYPQSFTPPPRGNPALAIVAALLGLAVAGTLGYQTADLLMDVPPGAELPAGWLAMVGIHLAVAAIALLGAILVFARRVAGAYVLLVAAALALAAVALDPVVADGIAVSMLGARPDVSANSLTAAYYELLVEFGNEQAVLRLAAAGAAAILLVIAALPPSVNYLRGSRRST